MNMCVKFLSLKNFAAGATRPASSPWFSTRLGSAARQPGSAGRVAAARNPPPGNPPPPQAFIALRNADAADPVGRACGWPLPAEGRPWGRLTPWR